MRIFLGLAEPVAGFLVVGFRFNDCNGEVWSITQEVVCSLLLSPNRAVASYDDAAIRECPLLVNMIVSPTRCVKFREDVLSTSVGFGE